MKRYTEHCDLCDKEFNNDKHGINIDLSYSNGGWETRKKRFFTPKLRISVCGTCFSVIEKKSTQMDETIKRLQNKKKHRKTTKWQPIF